LGRFPKMFQDPKRGVCLVERSMSEKRGLRKESGDKRTQGGLGAISRVFMLSGGGQ